MSNLLKETCSVLKEHGKTMQDVVWIGTNEVEIPVDAFKRLANKEYDSSYGAQEVAIDLMVCGPDWYMERHEYDGSEWWEFKEIPVRPDKKVIPNVIVDGSCVRATLKEMNQPGGKYGGMELSFDWEGMEA